MGRTKQLSFLLLLVALVSSTMLGAFEPPGHRHDSSSRDHCVACCANHFTSAPVTTALLVFEPLRVVCWDLVPFEAPGHRDSASFSNPSRAPPVA